MEINKIICGDCVEILPTLPNESINTVLTDPPFFLPNTHYELRDKSWKKKLSDLAIIETYFKTIFKECSRILKWHGHLLVNCDPVSYPSFFRAAYELFDFTRCLVWHKGEKYFSLGKGAWRYSFELILHARNSGAYFLKLDRQDVIKCPIIRNQERDHPAQKPVELNKLLIKACTPPNGIVLDAFCGSGSTCVAAKELGMNYIGIELDEEYIKIAEERLSSLSTRPHPPTTPKIDAFFSEPFSKKGSQAEGNRW